MLNKLDMVASEDRAALIKDFVKRFKFKGPVFEISALTREGCEPLVKLHVAANLRVGNDRARLIDVLTQLLPYIGYPRMLNALRALNEALET